MLKEEIALVREIIKEEIKLAFGNATPLAKQLAKEEAAKEKEEAVAEGIKAKAAKK